MLGSTAHFREPGASVFAKCRMGKIHDIAGEVSENERWWILCPFCDGGGIQFFEEYEEWTIDCFDCPWRITGFASERQACEFWNQRG